MSVWRVLGALVLSLLVGMCALPDATLAQTHDPNPDDPGPQEENPHLFDAIYFPWVPNGDNTDGTGPWYGSITVQNIDVEADNRAVRIWAFDTWTIRQIALERDEEGEPYSLSDALEDPAVPSFDLAPSASVTLSAGTLGLPEPGSTVAVFAAYKDDLNTEGEAEIGPPRIAGVQKQAAPSPMLNGSTSDVHHAVDGYSAIPFPDVAWGSQSDFCYEIRDGVDSCDGSGLHVPGNELAAGMDGHSYLPLVQTNSGWDTRIYLSNVDFTAVSSAQVNVTLTASGTQGAAAAGGSKAIETVNVPPGGTVMLDARSMVGDGWTGSAHISSTVGIGALAMRSKPDARMLMINTAAPSLLQSVGSDVPADASVFQQVDSSGYHQYAPLVFRDYNGWNTGISFVNLAEESNRVSAAFIGADGNVVHSETRRIPAQGQEFIYIPASGDAGLGGETEEGFVGAAVFHSEQPFHVSVDQVKYATGDAMSYLATAAGASYPDVNGEWGVLSLPLVQKGWMDGTGDTSGFQILNTSQSSPVTSELQFFDSAGAAVGPTRTAPVRMELGPRQLGTIYTLQLSEMSQNQRSSALLTPVEGSGTVVGVSNNVNYRVSGDGSVAFNLVNLHGQYRFPTAGFPNE